MSFVSYSQNFEDVMLWRALGHVSQGFYIDVGANDPNIDSVTKAFYERGWNGINVEPLAQHLQDLQSERPRDMNLGLAVGAGEGEIEIWESDVRGWASADADVIKEHTQQGHTGQLRRVPMQTLARICREHAAQEIHFLKVDVEGLEKAVLEGGDFKRFRPWVVIIEATRPNSIDEVHSQWEHLLMNAQYRFAYADGLNRFYVSDEHSDLLEKFRYPPNPFDGFVQSSRVDAEARAQRAEASAQEMKQQLDVMLASRSWRLTAPLRWGSTQWQRFREEGVKGRVKALFKRILRALVAFVDARPAIRGVLVTCSHRLGLYSVLRSRYLRTISPTSLDVNKPEGSLLTSEDQLTPRGQIIHERLTKLVQNKRSR